MENRIWTFSNFLSILRVLLLFPATYLLMRNRPNDLSLILLLLMVIVLTDYFDGVVARKFRQISDVGKVIDPLADKIGVTVLCLTLVSLARMPLWFFIAALVRDTLILLGGIYVKRTSGIILQSNTIGKWTLAVTALYILFVVLNLEYLEIPKTIILYASALMLLLSFVSYAYRFMETMRLHKHL